MASAANCFADDGRRNLRIDVSRWRAVVRGMGAHCPWSQLEWHGNHQVRARSSPARPIPLDTPSDLHRDINIHGGNSFATRRIESVSRFRAGAAGPLFEGQARRAISLRGVRRRLRGTRKAYRHVSAAILVSEFLGRVPARLLLPPNARREVCAPRSPCRPVRSAGSRSANTPLNRWRGLAFWRSDRSHRKAFPKAEPVL